MNTKSFFFYLFLVLLCACSPSNNETDSNSIADVPMIKIDKKGYPSDICIMQIFNRYT